MDEFPSWLNAVAAVYDSVPLWHEHDRIAVEDLLTALRTRCGFGANFEFELDGTTCLPAQMAIAGAMAISGLLAFSAASSEPGSVVKVTVSTENDVMRLEASFIPGANPANWPPLGLAVAAAAAGATYATCPDGALTMAVLVMPCH